MTSRFAALLAAFLLAACAARPTAEPAPGPAPALPAAAAPRVVVETAGGASLPVAVELARTDEERTRGMMHRRELAPEAGMLFVFSESDQRAFWKIGRAHV